MFHSCKSFIGTGLNIWGDKVFNVKDMSHMFHGCTKFNQDLSNWDVSSIEKMNCMFADCNSFIGTGLDNWGDKVFNVKDMSYMFYGCTHFNQDLSKWIVSNVTDMSRMFSGCTEFNQVLSNWDVSNVKYMNYMFSGCKKFNQDLSKWVVRNDTDMTGMFHDDSIMEISYKPRKTNTQTPKKFSNLFKFFQRSTPHPTGVKV